MDNFYKDLFDDLSNNDKLPHNVASLFNLLSKAKEVSPENTLEDKYGKPNEVNSFSDGIYTYKVKIWNLPQGRIKQTVSSSRAEDFHKLGQEERDYNSEIEEAINNEDYELAANIRDEKTKAEEKKVKNTPPQNLDDGTYWAFI
jgi:hypothetical protein